MPYTDFTLEAAETRLGLTAGLGDLFPGLRPVPVPVWLDDQIGRGRAVAALVSEKARSEFLVAPVLLACRELVAGDLAIYSGQRLDVDPDRGLTGECDYILALTTPVPRLRAPLVTVLEAKRGDIEVGLGQCAAQMVAARLFNERAGTTGPVYGAVTTGEAWQFLRLDGAALTLHTERLFVDNLGGVLAALQAALRAATPVGGAP
ncbi:MAG TPA: hypothetical protein VD866_21065 [Urbifossiella sp.]|nr:hypothetical protein [Urbifossiella sp.]